MRTIIFLFLIAQLSVTLIACQKKPQGVQGAYTHTSPAFLGAGVGSAYGATAAGLVTASIPIGALGLGALGTAIGLHQETEAVLLKKLQASKGVEVIYIGSQLRIIIFSDELFALGTSDIVDSAIPTLTRVSMLLSKYGYAPMDIQAYTDNIIGGKKGLMLSHDQAQSIQSFMWSRGINFRHTYPRGYGEKKDIANNRKYMVLR